MRGQVRSLPPAMAAPKPRLEKMGDRVQLSLTPPQFLFPSTGTITRRAIENALVIGGGPAGLAAAIKLAERGMQVVVLEMRSPNYSRPHHLNAREDTVHSLRDLGVYEQVRQASGWEEHPVCESKWEPLHGQADLTLAEASVGQVRISDVERALYEKSESMGILFLEGQTAQLQPGPDGMYTVLAEPVGGGAAESMGQPDLVVVADGANSPTRKALGIEFIDESSPRYYLGALIDKPIGPDFRKVGLHDGNQLMHMMATGHSKYPSTWISVEGDARLQTMSAEERDRYLADRGSILLDQKITPADIGWGSGQMTIVQNRRAKECTAGSNVLLVGDALRTGSVWVSGGLNLALTTDVYNLEQVVDNINIRGHSRQRALEDYDVRSTLATKAWHVAGSDELEGRIKMLEDNVTYICLVEGRQVDPSPQFPAP
jgi:2-polyprenyl-6-methoxyphenol hydroxylase-like FAD-dependent oxidoreductase